MLTHLELQVNPAAVDLFKANHNPLCIVGACGDYRTGKSFLLNSLFSKNGNFDVSPTIEPCTQGINILKSPLIHSTTDHPRVNVWVMDTEGFGSLDKDSLYDSKIFLLILMLSDVLIYNSKGALDEETISRLALICQEAVSLTQNTESMRSSMNTRLCWVLRDFALTLQDEDNNEITPN